MKECNSYKLKFEKALYAELSPQEEKEFQDHLSECKECSKEYEQLEETLLLVQYHKREEPREEFMNNFWNELNPKLNEQTLISTWWNELKSIFGTRAKLTRQIAVGLTILILGVMIGKFWLGGNDVVIPSNNIIGNEKNSQIAIQARAEKYIDRSKVLLLGLMNFDPESDDFETISFSHQQKISNELITEAANLKNELNKPTNLQLKELVSDIEIILMQIANLEEQQDLEGIDLIKAGVDKKAIFLKINIQEMKQSSEEIKMGDTESNKKENNT